MPRFEYRLSEGAIVNAGTVFLPETIRALSAIDLSALEVSPARRVLLLDREDSVRSEDLASRLDELGCDVDYELVEGVDVALDRPTEDAEAASELIARVAEWLGPADVPNEPPYGGSAAPVLPACTTMEWHGGAVREQFVRLAKGIVAGAHKDATLEIHHGIALAVGQLAFIHTEAGGSDRVVCRTKDAAAAHV